MNSKKMAFSLKIPTSETDARLFEKPEMSSDDGPAVPLLARSVLPGVMAAAFLAVGVFCSIAALRVERVYATAACAVVCLASSFFYEKTYMVRNQQEVPVLLNFVGPKRSELRSQAQEMAIDLFTGARFLVVTPFVVLRLLEMAGGEGRILGSTEWAFLFAILGPVLLLTVRAALDEFVGGNPKGSYNTGVSIFGVAVLAGAVAVYVILIIDLFQASDASTLKDTSRFYALFLIAYPVTALLGILFRIRSNPDTYPEISSVLKEILVAFSDVLGPLMLCLSTACGAFGVTLGGSVF